MNVNDFMKEACSITRPAIEMAGRLYGYYPMNDTIDEMINPTGVNYNHAYLCQCAIDCDIDKEFLRKNIIGQNGKV